MNSIRLKIITAFSIIITIFVIFLIVIFIINFNLSNKYKKIDQNIIYGHELQDSVSNMIETSYKGFSSKDYTLYSKNLKEVRDLEAELDLVFSSNDVNQKTKLAYRSVKNSLGLIIDGINKTKIELENNGGIIGISKSFNEVASNFSFVKENIISLIILETENISNTTYSVNKTQKIILYLTIIMIITIILFAFIYAFYFSRAITRPIIELSEISRKISTGNFDLLIPTTLVGRSDEIGIMSKSFDSMVISLKEKIFDSQLSNNKLDNKVKELIEINLNFENSQKAVINLLDDVEKEKEYSENLVKDLEKFKLAVDNVSDHVVITDVEGIVIYANKAVEKITGYTAEETVGKKAGKLWKKPMDQNFYEKLWRVIKNDKEVFRGELTNIRKNGQEYKAFTSISPVFNKNNEIVFFVGLERDVTKEKEIDQAKTEFVSLASHQLRTPLSTINWYTEMLISEDAGTINEDQKMYLEEIYTGSQRMVELVNSLLNVSRLELGTFIIEPELSSIVDLCNSVVKEIKPLAEKRKQKLEYKYDDNIPDILIDTKLLRMVFQNLLSNSIKYTQEEGTINLNINNVKGGEIVFGEKINEDSLLISVQDNGYGITKNQQDKIFSKLFRADNIRALDTEGTGLGLYIIKTIIDNSGGQIWFNSEEDHGTSFYIAIPLSGMNKKEGSKALS